jgi:23S rRNA (uracil1939-C5)-methyltransferase
MKKMKKNDTYTARVERYGSNGEGICMIDGLIVFVPYALVGEEITLKMIKVQKNFGIGKLLEIKEKSEERVNPPCDVFKQCGGCQLQHMAYEAQLALKRQTVVDAMERIGGFKQCDVRAVMGMDDPWAYRNKVQYPIGVNNNKPVSGFYAQRTHQIVEMDTCPVQDKVSEKIRHIVLCFVTQFNLTIYNEITGKGLLRHIIVRTAKATHEVMVILVINGESLNNQDVLIDQLIHAVDGIVSVVLNINKKKTNVIMGRKNRIIYGEPVIIDKLCGLTFRISPHAFYQINSFQTEKLYGKALEYAQLTQNDTVIDAYCGIGTISLIAAEQAKKVIGIEIVGEAIDDAKANASMNNIENVEFLCGESEVLMPRLVHDGLKADVVIVDPPRKGCDTAMLDAILTVKPKRVVYVSCNPATLARDLKYLCESEQYKIEAVQPVDMFPHTGHVETVVLMSRVNK